MIYHQMLLVASSHNEEMRIFSDCKKMICEFDDIINILSGL